MYLLFSGLVPPAVRSRGSKSIAAYMRALKNGKTMVVPVRVILIGATGAGKSSLLNALRRKFSMDVPLGKDELMAWSETVWEVTEFPTQPWVPFLVRNVSSPGDLPFHVEEWRPRRRPLLEWPAHLLKGNANNLYDLKIISWTTKTHLSLFLFFWIEVTKHIFGSFQ